MIASNNARKKGAKMRPYMFGSNSNVHHKYESRRGAKMRPVVSSRGARAPVCDGRTRDRVGGTGCKNFDHLAHRYPQPDPGYFLHKQVPKNSGMTLFFGMTPLGGCNPPLRVHRHTRRLWFIITSCYGCATAYVRVRHSVAMPNGIDNGIQVVLPRALRAHNWPGFRRSGHCHPTQTKQVCAGAPGAAGRRNDVLTLIAPCGRPPEWRDPFWCGHCWAQKCAPTGIVLPHATVIPRVGASKRAARIYFQTIF